MTRRTCYRRLFYAAAIFNWFAAAAAISLSNSCSRADGATRRREPSLTARNFGA